MALFLFSIFLMFAVFQVVGLTAPTDINSTDALQANIDRLAERAEEERTEAQNQLQSSQPGTPTYEQAKSDIAAAEETIADLEDARESVVSDVTPQLSPSWD